MYVCAIRTLRHQNLLNESQMMRIMLRKDETGRHFCKSYLLSFVVFPGNDVPFQNLNHKNIFKKF